MPQILDPSEIPLYAPSVTLTGAALDSAIAATQLLIEGPLGANRSIGLTKFTDTLNVSSDGRAYLSRLPLVADSLATPWSAKVRGGIQQAYGLGAVNTLWQDLEADQYQADLETGEVQLLQVMLQTTTISAQSYSRGGRNRPMQRPQTLTIQVTYWSGFDLSLTGDAVPPELLAIKQIAAQILLFQNSDQGRGVKSRSVDKEYSVSYMSNALELGSVGQNSTGFVQLDTLLKHFQKYKPRSYSI